ncbi:MAG: AmmeMemoRadiSam system protein A [Magnetococcales bacterium]|nr:AmmeMemoRadiSam system protein A [Magnetococcales bacterium]NGZ26279.1 AmmeMemoRadiSam system protein A [Magnetococcales bacterium]
MKWFSWLLLPWWMISLALAQESVEVSSQEFSLLLAVARHALTQGVVHQQQVDADQVADQFNLPASLRRPAGSFVTLKKNGQLRGCIGTILPKQPLHQAVVNNALLAALRDSRFSPVEAHELASLEVEVSVLSPLQEVAEPEAFQPGIHGVVMSKAGHQAVYLPEVAVEQGWNREQTLSHLSVKAGLSPDSWQSGSQFFLFTSQHAGEHF